MLANPSLGLVRMVVEYSFYNTVEVNQLETEEGGEGMGGKRKTDSVGWFVSCVKQKGNDCREKGTRRNEKN